jgi:hypothetical protein
MTLQEFIETLDEGQQNALALIFCEKTLAIWDAFSEVNSLEYTETVIGTHHTVSSDILARTVECIKAEMRLKGSQSEIINSLKSEFKDPVVALQDSDWELPKPVELSFFCFKNFLDRMDGQTTTVFNEPQIFVVINQAIEALMLFNAITEREIADIFEGFAQVK